MVPFFTVYMHVLFMFQPAAGKSTGSSTTKTDTKTEKAVSKQSAAEIDLLELG